MLLLMFLWISAAVSERQNGFFLGIGHWNIDYIFLEVAKYHYDGDEAAKEAYAKTLFGEIVPFYLEKLDKQAKENGGYLVGGKVRTAL